jgi:hypothetical protein
MANSLVMRGAIGALIGLLAACSGPLMDESEPALGAGWGKADGMDEVPAELAFATKVKVGDIIVTSDNPAVGCWYLNKLSNWATKPRFCHAALVVGRDGPAGISTIEALNEQQGIQIMDQRQWGLVSTKLAVLRVRDDQGAPLSDVEIQKVVTTAKGWEDVEYREPPLSLSGDPHTTGLYCSMLPFRAYLDATKIDLDAYWFMRTASVPFIVTPDELYEAKNSIVVHEEGPDVSPTPDPTPDQDPDAPPADAPPADAPPAEEPPAEDPVP